AGRLVPLFRQIRGVMAKAKDRQAATLLTEVGWGSDTAAPFGKGPQGQASQLAQAFKLLQQNSAAWRLARVYWFSLSDNGPGLCSFCAFHGLLTRDFQPKPAW